jgi:hypothetical protein
MSLKTKYIMKLILNIFTIYLLLLCFFNSTAIAQLIPQNIHFYGYYEGGDYGGSYFIDNKKITVPPRETQRHEFKGFFEGEDIYLDFIDVELAVQNNNKQVVNEADVQLTIIPKVARIKYIGEGTFGDDAISLKETKSNATWRKPIINLSKKITRLETGAEKKITFDKIMLKDIVDTYFKNKQWPITLKFMITIKYDGKKKVTSRILEIPLPRY